MDTEIENMLLSLTPDSWGNQVFQSQPKPLMETIEVLPTPASFSIKAGYSGPDYKYLVAKARDCVVVCAKANQFALAYNPRNYAAGQIPWELLERSETQATIGSEVYLALRSHKGDLCHGSLSWKAGEHIRVYKWVDRKSLGIGLNMATKEIGAFSVDLGIIKALG